MKNLPDEFVYQEMKILQKTCYDMHKLITDLQINLELNDQEQIVILTQDFKRQFVAVMEAHISVAAILDVTPEDILPQLFKNEKYPLIPIGIYQGKETNDPKFPTCPEVSD